MANGKKYNLKYDPSMCQKLHERATTVEDSLITQWEEGPGIFGNPNRGSITADLVTNQAGIAGFDEISNALYNYLSSPAFEPTNPAHVEFAGDLYNKAVLSDPRYSFPMHQDDTDLHPVQKAMLIMDPTSEESMGKFEDFKEHHVTRTAIKDTGNEEAPTPTPQGKTGY